MTSDFDSVQFEAGFRRAAQMFNAGEPLEQIIDLMGAHHTANYYSGAQAFADMFLGWTTTHEARRAEAMGLIITETRRASGGNVYLAEKK